MVWVLSGGGDLICVVRDMAHLWLLGSLSTTQHTDSKANSLVSAVEPEVQSCAS